MRITATRITGVLIALAAGPLASAQADWLTRGGNVKRTGFTTEAVLPPVSVAWKFATDPGNTYGLNPVIVGDMAYWITNATQYQAKPSFWPPEQPWPPSPSMQRPSWWPQDMLWPPTQIVSTVVAIRADTSLPVWRFEATDRIRCSPAYAGGLLCFGADNGVFYALDGESGELKWFLKTARAVRSAPAIVNGVIYFGTNDSKVYALDAAAGKQKWVFDADDDVYAAIAVSDVVWVACTNGTLYGLDPNRGTERWRIPFVGAGGLYSAPAVEGRYAYLAAKDRIYKVAASGVANPLGDALSARITAPPALGRRYLYVGCENGTLYALDAARGQPVWTHKFHGAIAAQPLITGNLVVAGGSQGEVVALDALTGAVRWYYQELAPWAPERDALYALMAAAASGGNLYLSWDDGNLACLSPDALDTSPPEISRRTPEPGSPGGAVAPTSEMVIGANLYDEGSGVNPADVHITLDGKPLELTHRPSGDYYYALPGSKSAPSLEDGWHTVAITAQDQRGNKASDTWTFLVHGEAAPEEGKTVKPGSVGRTERY